MGWCETNIAGFMTAFPVCVFYIILSLSSQIAMTWQNLRHFDCLQVASWDPFDLIESPGHEIISLSTVTSHNTSQVVTLVTHPATGKIKEGNTAQFQERGYSNINTNYCLTIALKTEDCLLLLKLSWPVEEDFQMFRSLILGMSDAFPDNLKLDNLDTASHND